MEMGNGKLKMGLGVLIGGAVGVGVGSGIGKSISLYNMGAKLHFGFEVVGRLGISRV